MSTRLVSAQEEERKRIAVEIHDSIGSSLSAIKMALENLLEMIGEDSGSAGSIQNLITITEASIDEARRIMNALRPSLLDDLGLIPALRSLCKSFRAIHRDIFIDQLIEVDDGDIPEDLKIVIYRIVQEAFNNIAKYARAEFVELSLAIMDDELKLLIEDNGQGFDLQAVLSQDDARKGLGISSMQERTEFSGGGFQIETAVGTGTVIRASWKLNARQITSPLADDTEHGRALEGLLPVVGSLEEIIPEKTWRIIDKLQTHEVESGLESNKHRSVEQNLRALKDK